MAPGDPPSRTQNPIALNPQGGLDGPELQLKQETCARDSGCPNATGSPNTLSHLSAFSLSLVLSPSERMPPEEASQGTS
jgi:hypothetical protein